MTAAVAPDGGFENDTYRQRKRRVERRLRLVTLVGASLTLFLAVLLSGDAASAVYTAVPLWWRALILMLLVFTGACIASAYIRYERELHALQVLIEDGIPAGTPSQPGKRWAVDADVFWISGLLLFVATAVLFVVAGWIATADEPGQCALGA
jgi:hypothetical protein